MVYTSYEILCLLAFNIRKTYLFFIINFDFWQNEIFVIHKTNY